MAKIGYARVTTTDQDYPVNILTTLNGELSAYRYIQRLALMVLGLPSGR